MIKMKDSGIPWIGQIPEDWEVAKLKNFTKFYSGGTPNVSNQFNYNDNGVSFVTIKDMSNNYLINKTEKHITKLGIKEKNLKILNKGTVLYSIYATVGEISELNINATINQAILALTNLKNINKTFLKYNLLSMKDFVISLSNGNTQFNLNTEIVKNFYLTTPSFELQQKIVEILDKKCGQIDKLVRIEENEIEKLKEYKTSLITKVVTKGLDPNAKMKDSDIPWIGQIPYDWEVKRLKYIADIFLKGNGITKDDVVGEGNTPCVRYGDIYTTYEFKFNECKTRTNKEKFSNLQYFTHGDILFKKTGELVEEIGKSVVYMGNKECLAGGDVVIMKHSQEPVFLGYALESSYVREQKSFGKLKLKVVHISIQDISNLYVALPTKNEQVIIGKYLDEKCEEIDNLIKIKQEKIEKLKEYKKSLIYQYVTGKKEV